MFTAPDPKQSFPKLEEDVIQFWKEHRIFEKSVEKKAPKGDYVFYDGPPFATGLPHYGHILASTLKDVVPRFFTMKGYRVERRWGWDCHGLPIENIIEAELKLDDKKAIEKYGIGKFNEACRSSVLRYAKEWGKTVERMGRWVDFENSYKTMDQSYMESIWWIFKKLWDKKLIYQGYKSMHICPRCETPLSNFEVGLGYKDVTDISVTIKLYLIDEPDTAVLAWTTTPWTLPGNIIAAVGKDITYVKVRTENEYVILAEAALGRYFPGEEKPEIVKRMKGKDLVHKKYKPLYDFYNLEHNNTTFKFYEADFVTTEDGCGVVHIAPGFGEDDYALCEMVGVPFIQHVGIDGRFKPEITPFAGVGARGEGDKLVIADLAKRQLLFREQRYTHSYPHCWRCETALLNYATESWFVEVTKMKAKMLASNKKINWVPGHIKEGRFGKWLEGARDWAISRNRFWGAPLPIWRCQGCKYTECFGSIEELKEKLDGTITRVTFMRHGESKGNIISLRQSKGEGTNLTVKGKAQAEKAAKALKNGPKIDIIIASPLKRTQQTAKIIAKALGVSCVTDNSIREINFGKNEGKTDKDLKEYIVERKKLSFKKHYETKVGINGESHKECEERMMKALDKIMKKYAGKHILIVSHSDPLRFAEKALYSHSLKRIYAGGHLPYAVARPHYVLSKTRQIVDLHKHFVDKMTFTCPGCKKARMKRIEEVLDCWFESGSMPYAQSHYPFENKEKFEKNFPAQFIAEGLDQTRGWFYTLVVLSTALFDEPAFLNVIVNGIVLAEDGQKMSKRKKNYPDPNLIFNRYGADAMRFYLMNSPVVKADDFRFSEKGVAEIVRNVILPFWNAYGFFVTYANIDKWKAPVGQKKPKMKNKLDRWIVSEFNAISETVTGNMEAYDLLKATDAIKLFLDSLTNWYIRRSRRRFWKSENDSDKNEAYSTLYYVLVNLAKLFAPFMPFVTEQIFKNMTGELSVHLSEWPAIDKKSIDKKLNREIDITRTIVTLGHAARAKERIKVRQPLPKIEIALPEKVSSSLIKEQLEVIKEELNIKDIQFISDIGKRVKTVVYPDARKLGPKYGADTQKIIVAAKQGNFKKLPNGNTQVLDFELAPDEIEIRYVGSEGQNVESEKGIVVILDTKITEELKLEGIARDIIRQIQDLRKKAGFNVDDRIIVGMHTDSEQLKKAADIFSDYIRKETLAKEIRKESVSEKNKEVVTIEGVDVELTVIQSK